MKRFPERSLAAVLLILLAGISIYSNTFQVPFVLDDYLFIEKNAVIRSLNNFFANSDGFASNPPRFVALLSFALNYHFGGLNVFGYHLVNLFIHLANGLMVYVLLRLTFLTPYFQIQSGSGLRFLGSQVEDGTGSGSELISTMASNSTWFSSLLTSFGFIPLFAALLFVVHPIQTQAVTYIVQRMTSLATLFYLLSLVLYVLARLRLPDLKRDAASKVSQMGTDMKRQTRIGSGIALLAGSVAAAVLAMLTKEMTVTLPLSIVLYEVFFFSGNSKRRLLYLLPVLATLPIVPLCVLSSGDGLTDIGDQLRAQTAMSRTDYLWTQFRVIVTYLRLLILPINQNLDYDYPVYTTLFTTPVLLSFLLLTGLFILALYLFKRTQSSRVKPHSCQRLIAFGILWFFLTLSVESSIIPIADLIFEHRLYLPSVGASAVFATGFFWAGRKICRTRAGGLSILVAACLLLCCGMATWQRNLVWGSEVGLWEDVVNKSPQKPRPYNNLGYALNKAGKPWEAIPYLMEALKYAPYYPEANHNLGRSYVMVDQPALAIPFLQKAIHAKPDLKEAYNDLAAALNMEGRYYESARLLEQNLGRFEQMPEVHFNLGIAYLFSGNEQAARRELATLKKLDPGLSTRLSSLLQSEVQE